MLGQALPCSCGSVILDIDRYNILIRRHYSKQKKGVLKKRERCQISKISVPLFVVLDSLDGLTSSMLFAN